MEIAERHFSRHEDIVFNAQKVYEFVIGGREYATRGGMNFEVEISEEQLGPGDVTYPPEQLIEDTLKANECEVSGCDIHDHQNERVMEGVEPDFMREITLPNGEVRKIGLQRGKDSDLTEEDARKFFDSYEEDLREEYENEQAQRMNNPDAA